MKCRGIRGATTVEANTKAEIVLATQELLRLLVEANQFELDDLAAAIFTTTPDLNAEFPAWAARQMGWTEAALMCGHEMNVPGALQKCIRVLLLVNTDKQMSEIQHVYIKGAKDLRKLPPDLPVLSAEC
ncbi:MAG: chorismate mutase [Candidatus Chloroheliales bacterium]|nr:MAG: chorismate mutase [Chloroflexota bacterium]